MFMCIDKPRDQKELFFTLNKALKVHSEEQKIRGCYAIYKEDICLYVGQSSNVPSRLATHLCGKYKSSDKVLIFEDISETLDLIPSEKYLIQRLKPIENILADYTELINKNELMDEFIFVEDGDSIFNATYEVLVDKYSLFIHRHEVGLDLHENHNMRAYIAKELA